MPDFGIFRGFNDKLFGNKLYAGQLPTQLGRIGSIDPDAQAFFDRVTTAGGTLSATEQLAIDTLVKDLKSYGIWSKMKAIYPMVGASAAACAQNLVSSSFTGTFNGGWTFASTGVTPNGTSGYMDTGLNASLASISASSMHISTYLRTNSDGVYCDIGAYGGSPNNYQISTYARLTNVCYVDLGAQTQTRQTYANTDSNGYYVASRTANNVLKAFKNNTLKGTNANTNTASILSKNIFISANNDSGGTPSQYSNRQTAFASIGDGLTDTEASNFYTAVQTFNTTLLRQV